MGAHVTTAGSAFWAVFAALCALAVLFIRSTDP